MTLPYRRGTGSVATAHTFDGVEEAAHRVVLQLGGMASLSGRPELRCLNRILGPLCLRRRGRVIDSKTLTVHYKAFERCPLCHEAWPENAVGVKRYSGARRLS